MQQSYTYDLTKNYLCGKTEENSYIGFFQARKLLQ